MEVIRGGDVFILKELLGKGGFSNVYYTEHKDKAYAVKVIKKTEKLKDIKLFQNELQIHYSIYHPNIVKIDSHFDDIENNYIILEYCNSKTLLDLYKQTNEFSATEIRSIIFQINDAVSYLHSHLIVHCDIKMNNIFLNNILQIKIGDFGLSTQLEHKDALIKRVVGTPNYIAPEVLRGRGYSYSCDIWAIGVIMYALTYKKLPFESKCSKGTYKLILKNSYLIQETSEDKEDFSTFIKEIFVLDINERISLESLSEKLLQYYL